MEDNDNIIYYYGGFVVILVLGIIFIVFYSDEIAWYYSLPMIILSISFLFLPTVLSEESKFRCIIPIFAFIFQILSKDISTLYKEDFINYRGNTTDTGEKYTEVVADWLLNNFLFVL